MFHVQIVRDCTSELVRVTAEAHSALAQCVEEAHHGYACTASHISSLQSKLEEFKKDKTCKEGVFVNIREELATAQKQIERSCGDAESSGMQERLRQELLEAQNDLKSALQQVRDFHDLLKRIEVSMTR